MGVEMNHQMAMSARAEDTTRYLGAMIPGEKRLVLVPLEPGEPWAAFKRLRSWMKDSKKTASVDVYETPAGLEESATVIDLNARRKTS